MVVYFNHDDFPVAIQRLSRDYVNVGEERFIIALVIKEHMQDIYDYLSSIKSKITHIRVVDDKTNTTLGEHDLSNESWMIPIVTLVYENVGISSMLSVVRVTE